MWYRIPPLISYSLSAENAVSVHVFFDSIKGSVYHHYALNSSTLLVYEASLQKVSAFHWPRRQILFPKDKRVP